LLALPLIRVRVEPESFVLGDENNRADLLVAARSGDDVLRQLAGPLKRGKMDHAATGMAGARRNAKASAVFVRCRRI
jgi:hypothetical protein